MAPIIDRLLSPQSQQHSHASTQLLNDVQHVEAAPCLGRILREGGEDDGHWWWKVVTARRADIDDGVVIDTLNMHRSRFSNDDDSAKKLISFGDTKADY